MQNWPADIPVQSLEFVHFHTQSYILHFATMSRAFWVKTSPFWKIVIDRRRAAFQSYFATSLYALDNVECLFSQVSFHSLNLNYVQLSLLKDCLCKTLSCVNEIFQGSLKKERSFWKSDMCPTVAILRWYKFYSNPASCRLYHEIKHVTKVLKWSFTKILQNKSEIDADWHTKKRHESDGRFICRG